MSNAGRRSSSENTDAKDWVKFARMLPATIGGSNSIAYFG
jgi:hypothetical protein